jgi:hypothetical protein
MVGFAVDLPPNNTGAVYSTRAGFEFRQGLVLFFIKQFQVSTHQASGFGLGTFTICV